MEKQSQQFWFVVRISRGKVEILSRPFTSKSDAVLVHEGIKDKRNVAVVETVYHWHEFML